MGSGERNNPFSLNWLLNKHPDLTDRTINQKNGRPVKKNTPVMLAVKRHARNCLEVLATDPRVDLDTTDKDGRGLEEVAALAGYISYHDIIVDARQRREEKKRQGL